ncbi:MAG: PKD domain-containing protein [Thermoplasmata archaeon]|nr:PKD domain-containing protein [Thermoplasmata archaeon]
MSIVHPSSKGPSPATLTLAWSNITSESTTMPPNMWFTEGTWDAADGYLFYYGGDNWAGANLASSWSYSVGSWSVLSTSGNPGPLDGPALAYDPPAAQVVMYGGLASYAPFTYTNLTWTYSGGTWSSAHLSPSPPARLAGSMVYDSALGGVVLFGGYDNRNPTGGTLLNDLWLYKAGAWSMISASNPPPVRTWAPIAYAPGLGEIVVFGGMNAAGQCLGDTWMFANGSWTNAASVGSGPPGPLCANSLLYDPDLGHILLTGGFGFVGSTQVNNTASWTFNGSSWLALPVAGHPSDHAYGPSAWDPSAHTLVVAGGNPYYFATDVLSAPLSVANITGPTSSEVGEAATFTATATGGVPQRTFTWDWGDGGGPGSGVSSTHWYNATGAFTVRVHVQDAAGHAAELNASILVTSGPAAVLNSAPASGDVGIALRFVGAASGGTGTLSLGWQFGDGFHATGASVQHSYLAVGTYPITLTVTDSVGGTGTAHANVSIYPALLVQINGSVLADAGRAVPLGGEVTGGEAPYSYRWMFDDRTNSSSVSPTHIFATAGAHIVQLLVMDGTGSSQGSSAQVQVAAYPALTLAGPTTLTAAVSGTWSANVAGGVQPQKVQWSFPDGAVLNGTTVAHAFQTPGSYVIHVSVTDGLGATANSTTSVTVAAAGGSGSSAPLASSALIWVGVGLAAAAVAAGSALVVRRRRRATPPPEE